MWLVFASLIIDLALGLPQNSVGGQEKLCSTNLPDYRCVPKEKCYVKPCNFDIASVEDEIFGPRQGQNEICSGLSNTLRQFGVCDSSVVRQATQEIVCCHRNDVLPDVTIAEEEKKCEEFEGFACIPTKDCHEETVASTANFSIDIREQTLEINEANDAMCPGRLQSCCKIPTEKLQEEEAPQVSKFDTRCGVHNQNGVDFHYSEVNLQSYETQFGEWPHVCYLSRKRKSNILTFLSGASLISPGLLLTAAHWVSDLRKDELIVTCGDWSLKTEVETRNKQERKVKQVVVHPSFNDRNFWNDVAIIEVDTPFDLDQHINVVCLPPSSDFEAFDKSGCRSAGWGKTQEGDFGSKPDFLHQVSVPFVEHDKCQELLRATEELDDNFRLDESFNCAGGEPLKDVCEGDGGGPLFCPLQTDPEHYVQVGIVAVGIGKTCGRKDVPGLYASIPNALCFIKWTAACLTRGVEKLPIEGCDRWPDTETARLNTKIDDYNNFMENNPNLEQDQRTLYESHLAHFQKSIERVISLSQSCT